MKYSTRFFLFFCFFLSCTFFGFILNSNEIIGVCAFLLGMSFTVFLDAVVSDR